MGLRACVCACVCVCVCVCARVRVKGHRKGVAQGITASNSFRRRKSDFETSLNLQFLFKKH